MKYTAEFTSIQGNDYRIEFRTQTSGADRTVKLGGVPFITQVQEGEDGLYTPVRCGGATVTLLTDECLFDLYSGQAQGVSVGFYKGETALWKGFVSPTMYDQGFDGELEEVEIDCVDGVAVLKNIPYRSSEKKVLTFLQIIRKCLKESGCFTNLYVSDNVQFVSGGTEAVLHQLRISENNFFEEKEDAGQDDDDVAWSCYEVLEELMRFLGYTLVVEGTDVYCIDYDAIKRTNPFYYRYSINDDAEDRGERVTTQWAHHVRGESYAENGAQVSLDKIYNKVTVSDDFRSMQTLFPSFGDEEFEENITADSDPDAWTYGAERPATVSQTVDGKKDNFQIFANTESVGGKAQHYLIIVKFYKSNVFRFHRYSGNGKTKTDYTDAFEKNACWTNMMKTFGAAYVKMFKMELDGNEYNRLVKMFVDAGDPAGSSQRLEIYKKFLNTTDVSSLKFDPMIIFLNHDNGHIGPTAYNRTGNYNKVSGQGTDLEDCQNYPCVTLRETLPEGIFGGAGSYFVIKGSFLQHDRVTSPFDLGTKNNGSLKREGDFKWEDELYFWMKFKWGSQWLSENGWTGTDTFYPVWWRRNQGDIQVKTYFSKKFELKDNSQAKFITSDNGIYVPAPGTGNLAGNPEITIYMNRDSRGRSKNQQWSGDNGNRYTRYYNMVQVIENFSIETKQNSGGKLDESELLSDTVYTNVIENGSISEMDEIKFKVCTYDNKNASYSVVEWFVDQNRHSLYLDTTWNRALQGAEGGKAMRQEEHMVFKCVTQYENPRVKFKCTLNNNLRPRMYGTLTDETLNGRTFVILGTETDWRMESITLKLLEKA